jgi:translation initiation factor 2 gamma subunit (eIF-2gamma)
MVDPALCRGDRLMGMIMSEVGKGPSIYTEVKAEGESYTFRKYNTTLTVSLPTP